MLRRCVLICALFVVILPGLVQAKFEAVQAGTAVNVTFTEPTTSIDQNGNHVPLDDYDHANITVLENGSPIMSDTVPASGPTGGQPQSHQIVIQVNRGEERTFVVEGRAVDTHGNASDPVSDTVEIDKQPPGPLQ